MQMRGTGRAVRRGCRSAKQASHDGVYPDLICYINHKRGQNISIDTLHYKQCYQGIYSRKAGPSDSGRPYFQKPVHKSPSPHTPNHESSVTAHQPLAEPNPCRGFITASRLSLEPSQSMSCYPGVEPTLCVLECRYHLFSIQFCSNSRSPPHISLFDVDPSLRDNLSPVQ
jgi:hypothetical protein